MSQLPHWLAHFYLLGLNICARCLELGVYKYVSFFFNKFYEKTRHKEENAHREFLIVSEPSKPYCHVFPCIFLCCMSMAEGYHLLILLCSSHIYFHCRAHIKTASTSSWHVQCVYQWPRNGSLHTTFMITFMYCILFNAMKCNRFRELTLLFPKVKF